MFEPVPKSVKFTESQLAGIPIDRYIKENHSTKESKELMEKLIIPYQAVVNQLLALEVVYA